MLDGPGELQASPGLALDDTAEDTISVIRQQSQSSVGLIRANVKVIEGWIRAKKCYYVGVKLSPDRGMNQWS